MWRWTVLLALGACLKDPTVPCGDVTCPAGNVCTAAGCATPEQVAACDQLAAGASCLDESGVCVEGVCLPVICGDNRVVGPEVCDDGNQRADDGCSVDCLSEEICGNDYPDFVRGEECDDAQPPGLSYDGCTSDCRLEQAGWRDASPAPPAVRNEFAFAYDLHRKRAMMFSGNTGERLTWEWDGIVWRRFAELDDPLPRRLAVAAYDAERREIVMFGGSSNNMAIGETWVWDGGWRKRMPATSPPPRWNAAMAYDPVRKEILLFGGDDKGYTDTWVWDGVTWTKREPTTIPPPFADSLLAWDASGSQLLLYQTTFATTWTWDGNDWTEFAGASPPMRPGAAMASDGTGILLFGGGGATTNSQTWRWANGSWTQLSPTTSPSGRSGHGMIHDAARSRVVLFGGSGFNPSPTNDVYEWNGSDWELHPVAITPPGGIGSLVYQPTRGMSLWFCGSTTDVWEWDGQAWLERLPAPAVKTNATMVATRDHVLLFGGNGAAGNETWTWEGTAWIPQTPGTVPPARTGPALAYDAARDRVVMFGGLSGGTTTALDDTWEWDGTNWIQLSPETVPAARGFAAMGYDARRRRVVMFGGGSLTDTWEWDGTSWVDVTPTTTPSPPAQPRQVGAWDARRGVFVVVGNAFGVFQPWEWDGAAWQEQLATNAPMSTISPAATYDAARGDLVVHGGVFRNTTFVFRFGAIGQRNERCIETDTDGDELVGCADPDCWARCTPSCPPLTTCDPAAPRCGDQICSLLEDDRLCPGDCPP